jgi:hypothetical protein
LLDDVTEVIRAGLDGPAERLARLVMQPDLETYCPPAMRIGAALDGDCGMSLCGHESASAAVRGGNGNDWLPGQPASAGWPGAWIS